MKRPAICASLLLCAVARCSFGQHTVAIFKVEFDEREVPKKQNFAEPIILNLRQGVRMPDYVRARFFRGDVAVLRNQRAEVDGCVHSPTALLPVTRAGTIQLPSLDDPAWLHPSGDGFRTEHWTIVFESGQEPDVEVFRLHPKELSEYFRYAFSMNLIPPGNLTRHVTERVREAEAVLERNDALYSQAGKSVCWGVNAALSAAGVVNAGQGIEVAQLEPCVNNQMVAAPHEQRGVFSPFAGVWRVVTRRMLQSGY